MHPSSLTLFALLVPFTLAFTNPHALNVPLYRRSHVPRSDVSRLVSRGRATFFNDGLGACGKQNSPSDFIIALAVPDFANGAHCFEMVTITCNGHSVQAQVVDECEGCPQGAIDMSSGLFQVFAPLSVGELQVEWQFSGSGNSNPPPSHAPQPSSTWTSSSSSTWKQPKTTSTTSTSAATSSTSSFVSSKNATASTAASTSAPALSAPTASAPQNIADTNRLISALAQLVLTSRQ